MPSPVRFRLTLLGALCSAALFTPPVASQCFVETLTIPGSSVVGAGRLFAAGGSEIVSMHSFISGSQETQRRLRLSSTGHVLSGSTWTVVGTIGAIDIDGFARISSTDSSVLGTRRVSLYTDLDQSLFGEELELFGLPIDPEPTVATNINAGGIWFAVGSPNDGAAGHVDLYFAPFESSTPVFFTTLTPPIGGSTGARFGASVSMSGNTLAISSPGGDASAVDGGHLYAYRYNGFAWNFEDWFAGDVAGEERFRFVGASDATIVAGAPQSSAGVVDAGRVDFIEYDGAQYVLGTSILGTTVGAQLGSAVDIDDDQAIVAAGPGESVRLVTREGAVWGATDAVAAPTPGPGFGASVAVDASENGIAGAPRFYVGHTGHNGGKGAIHVYSGETSATNDLGGGVAGFQGMTPTLATATDICAYAGPVNLVLDNMRPNSLATFIVGFTPLNVPFKGGTLVPSPDILVTNVPTVSGSVPLSANIPYGLSGLVLYMQGWVVDADAPKGLAASNGFNILFGQ